MAAIKHYADFDLRGSFTMGKELSSFPSNPRPNQFEVVNGVLWVWSTISGIQTWFPLTNKKSSYIHTQGAANDVWTVQHGLGVYGDLIYAIYGDDGTTLVSAANMSNVQENQFTLNFTAAITGRVVVFAEAQTFLPAVETAEVTTDTLLVGGTVAADSNGLTVNGLVVPTLNADGEFAGGAL